MDQERKNPVPDNSREIKVPQHPQERNLRERFPHKQRDFDNENVPEPVSFGNDDADIIEDEDLDRIERDEPKGDDRDDIKDSK